LRLRKERDKAAQRQQIKFENRASYHALTNLFFLNKKFIKDKTS
jgi:hypothetical protein